MHISEKKVERLTRAARLYYEEGRNQQEVAREMGVSRPMISRMLQEARDVGIVRIEIRNPLERDSLYLHRLREICPLHDCVAVPDAGSDKATNTAVARAAIGLLEGRGIRRLGLGWGSIIGAVVGELEEREAGKIVAEQVFPLVGSLGGANRNYHTNELVRVFAQQTGGQPQYLHGPAFFTSRQELEIYRELESFGEIRRLWSSMGGALINIGNHPSTPDFATKARFGCLLDSKKAVGRLLSYYFTAGGEIIRSDSDYTLQAPLEALAGCRNVTAVCSSNVTPAALLGALRTGLINNLIAPEGAVEAAVRLAERC